jgi:hypothetical protein
MSNKRTPELIAAIGAVLALVAVFLPWYGTDPQSRNSNIDGTRGDLSMWAVHDAMRWVLLVLVVLMLAIAVAAALQPDNARSLADPMIYVAVNAVGIVLYFGLLYRPGEPPSTISLRYGWFVALVGTLAPLVVAARISGPRRSSSPVAQRA